MVASNFLPNVNCIRMSRGVYGLPWVPVGPPWAPMESIASIGFLGSRGFLRVPRGFLWFGSYMFPLVPVASHGFTLVPTGSHAWAPSHGFLWVPGAGSSTHGVFR